jgi:hypothetical protein
MRDQVLSTEICKIAEKVVSGEVPVALTWLGTWHPSLCCKTREVPVVADIYSASYVIPTLTTAAPRLSSAPNRSTCIRFLIDD